MIPVRLKLTNFLSYGEGTPALDFEQFHVACLSGRNGQGKSALLDAMTWALWGEARKSQGTIKPDDDLLRIGCTDMRVELVFDLEGERYRVMRGYHRSKSGKTNKSELEVQLFDPGTDGFRPITQGRLRDTQQVLNNILGLEYETFVNSAFLLQGRSDRFTRKNATERKAILASILNLGKYDHLNQMAREYERKAGQQMELLERDVERLESQLAREAEWEAQHEALNVEAQVLATKLKENAAREKELQEQITALRVEAERKADLEQKTEALTTRIAETRKEAIGYLQKLEAAADLLARQAEIKANHARRESLQAERDRLDTQQDLHRGIERQIETAEREFNDWKNGTERKLTDLEAQQRIDRERVEDYRQKLKRAPEVETALEAARAAQKALAEMEKKADQLDALTQRKTALEKQIAAARAGLDARIEGLQKNIAQRASNLTAIEALQEQHKALARDHQTFEKALEAFETTKAEGIQRKEEQKALQARVDRLKAELKTVEENKRRIQAAEWKDCPTCGTPLTDAHRKTVLTTYTEQYATQHDEMILVQHQAMQIEEQLVELRQQARAHKKTVDQGKALPEALAKVRAEMDRHQTEAEALENLRREVETLIKNREAEAYAKAAQADLKAVEQKLDHLDVDQAQLQQLRREAAQLNRWVDAQQELKTSRDALQNLEPALQRREKDLARVRQDLDDGNPKLSERIRQLKTQLSKLEYDGVAHQKIKTELAGLAGIGEELANLLNAEQRKAEWEAAQAKAEARGEAMEAELAELRITLGSIRERLMIQEQVQTSLDEVRAEKKAFERQRNALQVQRGQLQARLEQSKNDRDALRALRKENKSLRRRRRLYKHLRGAFGKNGIPSLIIEQALPEIEQRTNELLGQLSDGLTHVRLETLKDRKTGKGTRETLEIRITDEQGVSRPYETFSGGEAFRVNFALRIALSQLLAERSGVRIRTLVIDEGFGTQDEEGVQNLVDAIQRVQDDFDKILVITHLKELKEAFPVRIEVVKHPVEGSKYELIGV